MNLLPSVRLVGLFALIGGVHVAAAAERLLNRATLQQLSALPRGEALTIDAFPVGPTHTASIHFERVQIYSDDARLYVMTANGRKEVPRSNRTFLRGYSEDGSARVAMSLNVDASFAEGNGSGPDGSFTLTLGPKPAILSAVALASTVPAGFKLDFRCGNELENLATAPRDTLAQKLGLAVAPALPGPHSLRLATVGVDTDSLFMSSLFNNDMTMAKNWIASMFNTMNTMYERDLVVGLLQGTTFLRIGSDPYGAASNVPADGTDLGIFGTYWQTNYSSGPNKVTRAFATLLSGRGPCDMNGCSASGIAWIDSYCQSASNGGSYSVVQVFSSLSIDPKGAIAAGLTGHELGHNFGAHHTQCTNASTGFAPTGTTTIDQCRSGEIEGGVACYSGPTSCPSSGPGAPAGTIMSYCNSVAPSGCGPGGQNVLQFHPAQATVLKGYISGQSACLNTTDDIFYNGFE